MADRLDLSQLNDEDTVDGVAPANQDGLNRSPETPGSNNSNVLGSFLAFCID